jgi:hypothetical protein
MCTFEFLYEDNKLVEIKNVQSVRIADGSSRYRNISGDELLIHQYSLDTNFFLITSKGLAIVSNKDLRSFTITKQG